MLRISAYVILGLLFIFSSGCERDETAGGIAEQESDPKVTEPHPLTEQDIRDLPKSMTVDELFAELWPVDLVDPPIFFYPSVVDDHVYMACPHPDDAEASIFHFRFVMPTKVYEPALWGENSFKEPYLPVSNPFDSSHEK